MQTVSQHVVWSRQVCAGLVGLMALISISAALFAHGTLGNPLVRMLVRDVLPMPLTSVSRSFAVLAGFALLVLAGGLWRGKRAARWLTLGLLVLAVCVNLLTDGDWATALSAALLGGLLLWQRQAFTRRSDPPTLRRIPLFVCGGLIAIGLYALAGFALLPAFHPFTMAAAVRETGAQLLWAHGPYTHGIHGRAAWFLFSLRLLGAGLFGTTLLLALRPVLPQSLPSSERRDAADLRARFGTSSLAPFALDPDKALYHGAGVAGIVAYRVAHGVAVVCGDPIAAPGDVGPLAQEFAAFCSRQDWQVCFYEAQAVHLPDYAPLGLAALKIGEDAWIALPTFTLRGPSMSAIRHAVSKVARDGTTWRWLEPQHDAPLWHQLQVIERGWRAAQRGFALRFSVGQLPPHPDPATRYAVALAADGTSVLACCSFLPIPSVNGWALDLLRRAPGCPNGTMEFLLARALENLRDAGATWCSLGLAPLAETGSPVQTLAGRGLRALSMDRRVNAFYHYQSLIFFKRKFNPEWRSGYLLYPRTRALPRVLMAIARVHLPDLGPMLGRTIRSQLLSGAAIRMA